MSRLSAADAAWAAHPDESVHPITGFTSEVEAHYLVELHRAVGAAVAVFALYITFLPMSAILGLRVFRLDSGSATLAFYYFLLPFVTVMLAAIVINSFATDGELPRARRHDAILSSVAFVVVVSMAALELEFDNECAAEHERANPGATPADVRAVCATQVYHLVLMVFMICVTCNLRTHVTYPSLALAFAALCVSPLYLSRATISTGSQIVVRIIVLGVVYIAAAAVAFTLNRENRESFLGVKKVVRLTEETKQMAEQINGLLEAMLPESVLVRLAAGEHRIFDMAQVASVAFADVAGFTDWSSDRTSEQVVQLISALVSAYDVAAKECQVAKVKTIGDAYWAISGLPEPTNESALRICNFALRQQELLVDLNAENPQWGDIELRVGCHTGHLAGGVIGTQQLAYEVFGETNDIAEQHEQNAPLGGVLVSLATMEHAMLSEGFAFAEYHVLIDGVETYVATRSGAPPLHLPLHRLDSIAVMGDHALTSRHDRANVMRFFGLGAARNAPLTGSFEVVTTPTAAARHASHNSILSSGNSVLGRVLVSPGTSQRRSSRGSRLSVSTLVSPTQQPHPDAATPKRVNPLSQHDIAVPDARRDELLGLPIGAVDAESSGAADSNAQHVDSDGGINDEHATAAQADIEMVRVGCAHKFANPETEEEYYEFDHVAKHVIRQVANASMGAAGFAFLLAVLIELPAARYAEGAASMAIFAAVGSCFVGLFAAARLTAGLTRSHGKAIYFLGYVLACGYMLAIALVPHGLFATGPLTMAAIFNPLYYVSPPADVRLVFHLIAMAVMLSCVVLASARPLIPLFILGLGIALAVVWFGLVQNQRDRSKFKTKKLADGAAAEANAEEALQRQILASMAPAHVQDDMVALVTSDAYKAGEPVSISHTLPNVTVCFCKIKTKDGVEDPHEAYDDIMAMHQLVEECLDQYPLATKIKSVGTAIIVAGPLHVGASDDEVRAAAKDVFNFAAKVSRSVGDGGQHLAERVGVSSGPIVASVMGTDRLAYDIFGDTVNTAARCMTTAPLFAMQSPVAHQELYCDATDSMPPGQVVQVAMKGKGAIEVYRC
jgi:class 3 adenylate cyclase